MRLFTLILVDFLIATAAHSSTLDSRIDAAAQKAEPRVIECRCDIHQHPELGNRELRTSKLVADRLRELGIEVKTPVAHTGVIGILRGGTPGRVVALRADMDALPVTEQVDVPFKSTVNWPAQSGRPSPTRRSTCGSCARHGWSKALALGRS